MKKHMIWLVAAGIGVANAILLVLFEFVGVTVTNWFWNNELHTDTKRWLVVPVAAIFGLLFTFLFKLLHTKRLVSPESDLMEEINTAPATLPAIGVILAVGAMSLLAGGSIGPEASLMAASAAIGMYSARKWRLESNKQLLVLASVGGLLIAFIGSYVLILIPLLIFIQQAQKKKQQLQLKPIAVILIAGLFSYGSILLVNSLTGESGGYGTLPSLPAFKPADFVIALVLGFVAGLLALALNWFIDIFWKFAKWVEKQKIPAISWSSGVVFGLVLGALYLWGGRTIEFSGSIGASLLASQAATFSAVALAGLIITKILATAWSKGTGYRGGLVFPTIYIGVALGLLVGQISSGIGGAGAIIGGIAGMLTAAVGSPIMAGIFLIAILPVRLWPVAGFAIIGTLAFNKVAQKIQNKTRSSK